MKLSITNQTLTKTLKLLKWLTLSCIMFKMVKHTLKILRCSHHKIFKVFLSIFFRKSYFTHYSIVVFILLNTGLCKSAFSTNSFRKLVFLSLCAFCLFCLLCVEFDVIFINFITFAQSLFGHVICVFVLTYEKLLAT